MREFGCVIAANIAVSTLSRCKERMRGLIYLVKGKRVKLRQLIIQRLKLDETAKAYTISPNRLDAVLKLTTGH